MIIFICHYIRECLYIKTLTFHVINENIFCHYTRRCIMTKYNLLLITQLHILIYTMLSTTIKQHILSSYIIDFYIVNYEIMYTSKF